MDIKLHYTEKGTGEPLILLHGNGGNSDCFVYQISYFARNYRVIAIETRGHGRTPRGTAPFTIRQFAEDLHHFMDKHGIEKANLLGFSDGGNIALVFALKYPERVKNLIIDGANLDPSGVDIKLQLSITLEYYKARLFSWKSQKIRGHAEMLRLLVKDPNIKRDSLKNLNVRTLVMAGTQDLIKESHTRLIARNIPGAELKFIEGGHGIASENPLDFNKAVEKFLSGSEV